MISRSRYPIKKQLDLQRWKGIDQHKGSLTREERFRIAELQDLLIDRFVEYREATAEGQQKRVETLEAEIDDLLRRKDEI